MKNLFAIIFIFGASIIAADAQIASGESYTIEKSDIAGNIVEGTIGLNTAGTKQQNAAFTFQPGFWNRRVKSCAICC